ncbi:hypothetical protein QPK82_19975, partial [Acinetobacter baumannii]
QTGFLCHLYFPLGNKYSRKRAIKIGQKNRPHLGSVYALIAAMISGNFQIRIGIENNIKKASIVCHNPYFSIDTFISSTIGLKCSI